MRADGFSTRGTWAGATGRRKGNPKPGQTKPTPGILERGGASAHRISPNEKKMVGTGRGFDNSRIKGRRSLTANTRRPIKGLVSPDGAKPPNGKKDTKAMHQEKIRKKKENNKQ